MAIDLGSCLCFLSVCRSGVNRGGKYADTSE